MMEKLPYSGRTSSYVHKHEPWQEGNMSDTPQAVRKQWVLDAQWTNCPREVEDQVKDLWRYHNLGNDNYILKYSVEDLLHLVEDGAKVEQWHEKPANMSYEECTKLERQGKKIWGWIEGPIKVDYVVQYLREMGVADDETVWIHWWW